MRKRLTPTQAARMLNNQANPVGRINARIERYEQWISDLWRSGKLTEKGKRQILEYESWIDQDRKELKKYLQ